jgi:dUTPase
MKVKIKLEEGGKIPVKGEPNAMCFDCYARKIEQLENGKVVCHLGFSATPPQGYGIRLIPRSNLTKYFWVLNNSIGIGDEDYKNEYLAIFTPLPKRDISIPQFRTGLDLFPYEVGERVCQMEIYKREDFEFEEVTILPGNDRGGGFGSTNLK